MFADAGSLGSVEQLEIALIIRLGQLELRLVQADLGLGLIVLGLVRPGIDLEEHVVFLDFRPLLEGHVHQETGDACLDFLRLNGPGAPRILHVVRHLALHRKADGEDRQFRVVLRQRRLPAAAEHSQRCHDQEAKKRPTFVHCGSDLRRAPLVRGTLSCNPQGTTDTEKYIKKAFLPPAVGRASIAGPDRDEWQHRGRPFALMDPPTDASLV